MAARWRYFLAAFLLVAFFFAPDFFAVFAAGLDLRADFFFTLFAMGVSPLWRAHCTTRACNASGTHAFQIAGYHSGAEGPSGAPSPIHTIRNAIHATPKMIAYGSITARRVPTPARGA